MGILEMGKAYQYWTENPPITIFEKIKYFFLTPFVYPLSWSIIAILIFVIIYFLFLSNWLETRRINQLEKHRYDGFPSEYSPHHVIVVPEMPDITAPRIREMIMQNYGFMLLTEYLAVLNSYETVDSADVTVYRCNGSYKTSIPCKGKKDRSMSYVVVDSIWSERWFNYINTLGNSTVTREPIKIYAQDLNEDDPIYRAISKAIETFNTMDLDKRSLSQLGLNSFINTIFVDIKEEKYKSEYTPSDV